MALNPQHLPQCQCQSQTATPFLTQLALLGNRLEGHFQEMHLRTESVERSIVDVQNGWARISHDGQRTEGRLADLEARSQRMEALLATLPESLSSLRKTVDELERRVEMSIDDAHNNITILINAVIKQLQVPKADLIELQQYRERGQVDVDG